MGVPPWWCDRTRYPDEPSRIAREITQGVIHLKPLQHDPSPGLGGTYGPFSLAQTTKDARRVEDPSRSHQESDSLGVPPWWCDRTRYPDEPARIAREIMQGVIHLKPLQHDPSPELGGTYGPFSLAQTTKDARRVDPLKMNQLGLRGKSRRAPSISSRSNTILVEDLEDPVVLIVAAMVVCPHPAPSRTRSRPTRESTQSASHHQPRQHDPTRGAGGPHLRRPEAPDAELPSGSENLRNLIDWGSRSRRAFFRVPSTHTHTAGYIHVPRTLRALIPFGR